MKIDLKNKAIGMRLSGHSFREISEALNLAKSTVRLWVGAEVLNNKAQERIRMLGVKGREKANKANKTRREIVWKKIADSCHVLRDKNYGANEFKLFLSLLYWGEGAKSGKDFNFVNSDSVMIKAYLYFLRSAFYIDNKKFKVRVHLHEYHNKEDMLHFWSDVTGICKNQFSVYNKPHTGKNKKPGYKGCLSIRYKDSKILKEIFIIIKRFKKFT